MKKNSFTFLFMIVSIMLMFPLDTQADVLITPNNDFYTRHSDECVNLNRSFYTNGESGFVSLKKEPGSKEETAQIENGNVIEVLFTYDYNGETWGVAEIDTAGVEYNKWPNGWVAMNQLLLKYDYISFAEDYQSEIYSYAGGYEWQFESDNIVFWTWPGSGKKAFVLENEWKNGNYLEVSEAYQDADGREWGFFVYIYGNKNAWVCLSDPGNTKITAFNPPPEPQLWQSSGTNSAANGVSMPVLIVVLVAVLVVATVVLIRIFWKPNRDNS